MSDHDENHSHAGTYFTVFIALCVFTGMSIVADLLHFSNPMVTRALVMSIATAKALCVMMYFMHLKFERAWKYLLLIPTGILAMALPFALFPDVGAHYYTPDVPQVREYAAQQAAGGDHHGGDHHGKPEAEHH
jgi:cytochrome c oxidase subunit IV